MATEAAKVEAAHQGAAEAPKKKTRQAAVRHHRRGADRRRRGRLVCIQAQAGRGRGAERPAEKASPKTAALYFKYDPAFVVNFGGEGSARYLQVMVEAMTRDPPTLEMIKNNEPAVRNDLVMLFSSQDNATLLSPDGKEKLRNATLEAVRKIVAAEGGDPKTVENVYFTSFVIQ